MKKFSMASKIRRLVAIVLILSMLSAFALAEETPNSEGWLSFFLLCNEGMTNEGFNVGNTMMAVSMNPENGKIRLMMFTWDTFVQYEGYDLPQLMSTPYRNNGPESTMKVFNDNFDMDISNFISLNFLNLASVIDAYGGVNVDITRAERNALNGMVSSKKWSLEQQAASGLLSQMAVENLAQEYYLNEYGPNTHLNGLQAVGYGWLQYDSVYNCCQREVEVNADLFNSVANSISQKAAFYTNDTEKPEVNDNRRIINLDEMSDKDVDFLHEIIAPIFQMSYNNLTDEQINSITITFAKVAYQAARQGVNIFDMIETSIFPLEATQEYDIVAGTRGHLVDYEENARRMKEYLYSND